MFILSYAMAMEQGLCTIPKGARYLSLIWLMGCVVLGTSYKSTLRSNLSFPAPERIAETTKELVTLEYNTVLHSEGVVEVNYIETTNTPAIVKLRDTMKYNPVVEECITEAFLNQKTACISWFPRVTAEIGRLMTVNKNADNPLFNSKDFIYSVTMTMAFQKNSMFVDSFRGITSGSHESGLYAKWEQDENLKFKAQGVEYMEKYKKDTKVYKKLLKRTLTTDSDRKPLTLNILKVVFGIIPMGVILGALAFCLEKLIFKRAVKRNEVKKLKNSIKNGQKKLTAVFVHKEKKIRDLKIASTFDFGELGTLKK